MDAAYPEVPVEMMKLFHSIDRELYSILIFELHRDPKESVDTIALWIWLERENKFIHVVSKILKSPIELINGLADEAVACLRCITNPMYLFSPDASEISLTQNLFGNQFSLEFFHENRAKASYEIRMVLEKICIKVLFDLLKMAINRTTERQSLKGKMVMMPPPVADPTDPMEMAIKRNTLLKSQMVMMPPPVADPMMDPMIARFGGLGLMGESSRSVEESKHDKTMFATFSKGYPVSEMELRGYFTRMFGDCVESIYMQEVKPNEQSLFARVVFYSPATVDLVLRGREKAKFTVKGKQVWVRKFVPKT